MSSEISYSIKNIPHSIVGCGLGNLGASLLILHFALNDIQNNSDILIAITLCHVGFGLLMFSFHIASMLCFDLRSNLRDVLSVPSKIIVIGIYTIAVALVSKLITVSNCFGTELSIDVGVSLLLISTCMSFGCMFLFIGKCILLSVQPEPYFCIGLFSFLFPAALMPKLDSSYILYGFCNALQDVLVVIGICLSPVMLYICYRVFFGKLSVENVPNSQPVASVNIVAASTDATKPYSGNRSDPNIIVANNPTVVIMQAGPSVLLAAWISHPLVPYRSQNELNYSHLSGGIIVHCLFGFAWVVCICSMIALYQRSFLLRKMPTTLSHQFSSLTFPFFNTALASYAYSNTYTAVPIWLSLWVGFISCVAYIAMVIVNGLFIYYAFYSGNVVVNKVEVPVAESKDDGTVSAADAPVDLEQMKAQDPEVEGDIELHVQTEENAQSLAIFIPIESNL